MSGIFEKGYRHLDRVAEIVRALAKYGFIDVAGRLPPLTEMASKLPRARQAEADLPLGIRLRLMLSELGPTFIKFGQVLSSRADIVPPDILVELAKLQDSVPPSEFGPVKKLLTEELGANPDKIFEEFNEKPIGSASIAQVYEATLPGREDVIVKVLRPGIGETVEMDIEILEILAELVEKYVPELRRHGPVRFVREFAKTMRDEMDLRKEARHAERVRRDFSGDESVYIPRIHWKLTSRKVFVQERIHGTKLGEARLSAEKKHVVAKNLALIYMKMIYNHGFFQADPHPGNFFLVDGNVIGIVDFGMVGHIDPEMRERFESMIIAFANRDSKEFVRNLTKIGVLSEETDMEELEDDLFALMDEYYGFQLNDVRVSDLFIETIELVRKHKVRLKARFALLGKTALTMDGFLRQFDPEFELSYVAGKFAKGAARERLKPEAVLAKTMQTANEFGYMVGKLPRQIGEILDEARKGKFKIEMEHLGLKDMVFKVDRAINRITVGLLTSSLIVGSALILQGSPQNPEFSTLGLAGFVIAGIVGIALTIKLLRSGI